MASGLFSVSEEEERRREGGLEDARGTTQPLKEK